jgi:restriction endonuclease S subunit
MEYLEELKSREILDGKYITRLGDIIVRLSSPNTAVTIGEHETGLIISSLFVVVRLSSNVILPEYLGIFLNTEQIKRIYAKSSAGSVMQIIRTSVLKDINVKAVSTENQEKIIGINKLILREKKLLEELIDKKNKYHSIIINKIFKDRLLSH